VSGDLAAGLRELAASGQAPPPVPGPEIRRRAGARRRRRRTVAAVSGASAAAALGVVLLLSLTGPGTEDRTSPAATPAGVPSTRAAAVVTVDLSRRMLIVGSRAVPVSAGARRTPTPTGRMTVTALTDIRTLSGKEVGLTGAYGIKVPWVVELSADDGTTTYFGGLAYDAKAPGRYDTTSGWIGLGLSDAKWLYKRLSVGDVVDIESGEVSPSPAGTSKAADRSFAGTAATGPSSPPAGTGAGTGRR
jgi:lipoprotein-anchoring transpeptidase ErfK/SrfK